MVAQAPSNPAANISMLKTFCMSIGIAYTTMLVLFVATTSTEAPTCARASMRLRLLAAIEHGEDHLDAALSQVQADHDHSDREQRGDEVGHNDTAG